MSFSMRYDMPLFRPPSEAESFIFQITHGCSWNRCIFCDMYSAKKFWIKPKDDVLEEIRRISESMPDIRRVFLADGDAMVLSTELLLQYLDCLRASFPLLRRISCYASPGNLCRKSKTELGELCSAGLKLVYTGIETGDDELLSIVVKGETSATTIAGLVKARQSGMKCSVMILNALGGKTFSAQHAKNSARVVNEIRPEYLSTLVLIHSAGEQEYARRFGHGYVGMTTHDILAELRSFLADTQLEKTIFRSDHASNYLVLKGILGRDREKLLQEIDTALSMSLRFSVRRDSERHL